MSFMPLSGRPLSGDGLRRRGEIRVGDALRGGMGDHGKGRGAGAGQREFPAVQLYKGQRGAGDHLPPLVVPAVDTVENNHLRLMLGNPVP